MIRNFASKIAATPVSDSWVTRFLNRNTTNLVSKWTTSMDRTRHAADLKHKYKLWFELLHSKIKQHNVLPCNTYNMDEKGFMIGVLNRSKRVFSRRMWEKKEVRAAL
jgi:hypothetical protein